MLYPTELRARGFRPSSGRALYRTLGRSGYWPQLSGERCRNPGL